MLIAHFLKLAKIKNKLIKKMKFELFGEINESLINSFCESIYKEYSKADTVELVFNSGGGLVDAALQFIEILDELKELGSKVLALNDGNVCSSATLIWSKCDERIFNEKNGIFLIHNPFIENVSGDAESLIEKAVELSEVEKQIIDIYRNISGKNEVEIGKRMSMNVPMSLNELNEFNFITNK